jgi:hypothetical protein
MAIHNPISKALFTLNGAVKTSGGTKNLAKGQFAIVVDEIVKGEGLRALSDFAGISSDANLKLRLGLHKVDQRSKVVKVAESSFFKPKDIVSLKANFPKVHVQKFDEYIVGYDGINANTAIELEEGQNTVFDIEISGTPVEIHTGKSKYVVKQQFGRLAGETNQEAVLRLVERLKEFKLPYGTPLSELLDIKPVDNSNPTLSGTEYVFKTLTLTDSGNSNSFAEVQAQYAFPVVRTDFNGNESTYTVVVPATTSVADFSKTTVKAYIKGCAACVAGYTGVTGGVVYSISIEDDGTDLSTTVDNLPGFVSGTVIRHGVVNGKGLYTVVLDDELTAAEKATFLATNATTSTAEFKFLGAVEDACEDSDTVTTAWVNGDTCFASVESWEIQLADNECGQSRLTELQAAYPSLTIEAGDSAGTARQTVTLSGSSGNAVITVAGTNYTTAFDTSLTVTAANFVTSHAAAILAATGLVVTSNTAVITFTGNATGFPLIEANAGGLTETVSSIDYITTAVTGGCQRKYSTQVLTNVVCEECDKIFVDKFKSLVAPEPFEGTHWEKVASAADADALMGIKIKGKPFIMKPTKSDDYDEYPFYETSTCIESISGGYAQNRNENFAPVFDNIFNVKRLSKKQDRDALGAHFVGMEEESRVHYAGHKRHRGHDFAIRVYGEESVLELDKQYVTYELTWKDTKFSQGMGSSSNMAHTEIIVVEFGYHDAIETLLNKLAAKAGVDGVNPTAN